MPDLHHQTDTQDEFYIRQQQYIEEELSFLDRAREQMRSYNDQFSAQSMEGRFVQTITPPDPMTELLSPVEEEMWNSPRQESVGEPAAETAPLRRSKNNAPQRRSAGKLQKTARKGMDRFKSAWQTQTKLRKALIWSIAIAAVLVFALFLPWGAKDNLPTIRRGVTIDGVSVAGMTREQAIGTLATPLDEKVAGTRIILSYAGESWTLDSIALGLHHDLEAVVDRALALDRPNRLIDWIGDFFKMKKDARALETTIVVSEVMLRTALAQECGIVDETVVEGSVTFAPNAASEAGLFTITAPRSGRTIDFTRLVADIRVAVNEGGVHQIAVQQTATAPKHTLSELKLSVSCISQVTIDLSIYNETELANITSALGHINGVCVDAGKNFSFNTYAAPYSGENGYIMQLDEEVGEYAANGIHVAATLMYRAGLLGDMKLLTRFAPQTPVEYAAVGLDASVGNMQDLVFKNADDYPVYICASVRDNTATVTIYSMPPEDSMRVQVETQIVECGQTPVPNEVINDGTYTLTDGQSLDLVLSTPACTVRTWRVYYDKFGNELRREQIGTDCVYEEVVGTRIVAAQE